MALTEPLPVKLRASVLQVPPVQSWKCATMLRLVLAMTVIGFAVCTPPVTSPVQLMNVEPD